MLDTRAARAEGGDAFLVGGASAGGGVFVWWEGRHGRGAGGIAGDDDTRRRAYKTRPIVAPTRELAARLARDAALLPPGRGDDGDRPDVPLARSWSLS